MKSRTVWSSAWPMLAVAISCLALSVRMSAQVQTETSTTHGTATHEVQVQRAEVVHVSGNDVVVKMEDGTIRHIANVPDSFRAVVDGKEIGVLDLKTGMILERTTTITTTPKIVKTVETVKGRVWHVQPPNYVFLTLEDGSNQRFEIPKGQRFNVEGQMVDARGLKPGMNITATKVVEFTATEVEQQRKLTGSMPVSPPAGTPILIAK